MATSMTYEGKYILAVYDNQGINKTPMHELASTEGVMVWNKSRFPDLESRSNAGLRVNTYIPGLATPETVVSGVLKDEDDGKWVGAKRSGGDGKFFPLFKEGQFQYKNNWYTLASERTVQEAANLTSLVESTETAFRHRFHRQPVPEYGARATVFKRESDLVPRPYIDFQLVDEFTTYAGHQTTIYHKGGYIDWSVVDNTVPECMIDKVQASSFELVFNQDLTSLVEVQPYYTPASLNERLPYLSTCIPTASSTKYLTEYFPVRSSNFNFYTYDGTNVAQWTATSTFDAAGPSDLVYILNPSMGEIVTNTNLSSFPGEPLCEFEAVPLVEYRLPTDEGDYYSAQESGLARITTNIDRGSVIYALRDPEIFNNLAIQVEIPSLFTSDNTQWTNSFYGDSVHKIVFTVVDTTTSEVVAGVPLKITKESGIGQLLGINANVTLYTDENGEAFTYFLPPMLGESIGLKDVTRGIDPKELVLDGGLTAHHFENIPKEIYLYGIYKDDPLLGRIDDPTNFPGTVIWDPVAKNGRKRVLYEYDPLATHPIYDTLGAFAPVRPLFVTSDRFVFANDLPLDEPLNDSNNLGGYFVAGPRRTNCSVEVDIDVLGISTTSSVKKNFNIITGLSSFAKGHYVVGNVRYPYGWRLPGNINPSSQLGGTLYLTINPVAGTADILFETSQQYKHFSSALALQVYVTNV
jgi:hypothetical protein